VIALSTIEPRYLAMFLPATREFTGQSIAASVDPAGYLDFLREVEARTPPGSRIAIVVSRRWFEGYSYAYYRANYVLRGREVLPVITPDDRPLEENFESADFVAGWHCRVREERHAPVWSGFDGTLYVRRDVPR
jgi:hypothetical protein